MSRSFAVCSLCGWSQRSPSGSDAYWLLAAHARDAHEGPSIWVTRTSSQWRPPVYDPGANDADSDAMVMAG